MCVGLAVCQANAQNSTNVETVEYSTNKHRVETSSFWSNWYLSVGGGGQVYFGDHDKQAAFKNRIAPSVDVALGKWFTPEIGVRLMYSGISLKGATQTWNPDSHTGGVYNAGKPIPGKHTHEYGFLDVQKFKMGNIHADVMINLVNLFGGYKEDRKWEFSPYIGLGMAFVYDSPKSKELTGNAGVLTAWNFSKAVALNLDVRGMLVNDRFDGEVGGRSGEGSLSATLGLTFKFKPRGWGRSKTVYRTEYRDQENLRRLLDELNAKNEQLQKALNANDNSKIETVTKKIAGDYLVIFEINKIDLSNEARANLGMLAEVIKSGDPDIVYSITGYADSGTGNRENNEYLSKGRAENVYNCLINEFGVNKKQLVIDYKGGVDNMFYDDPRLSRSVIITPNK